MHVDKCVSMCVGVTGSPTSVSLVPGRGRQCPPRDRPVPSLWHSEEPTRTHTGQRLVVSESVIWVYDEDTTQDNIKWLQNLPSGFEIFNKPQMMYTHCFARYTLLVNKVINLEKKNTVSNIPVFWYFFYSNYIWGSFFEHPVGILFQKKNIIHHLIIR